MQFQHVLKKVGLTITIAGLAAPWAMAQFDPHARYLEIKKQYEKDHPVKPPVVMVETPKVTLFPSATRIEPGLGVSPGMADQIKQLTAFASVDNKSAEAIAVGEAIIANSQASRFDRAYAFRTIGYVYLDDGDPAKGIDCLQKSLNENAFSNNDHYSLMLQIARTQIKTGQADAGLATLARVVTETKVDKPEYDRMRGRIYYMKKDYADAAQALQKSSDSSEIADPSEQQMLLDSYFKLRSFPQAEKVGQGIVDAEPGDKVAIMNLATVYRQDGHAEKALVLIDDAHKRGVLSAADTSHMSYVFYSDR
jgi:tetratricopeptide (TPR) repeat protein